MATLVDEEKTQDSDDCGSVSNQQIPPERVHLAGLTLVTLAGKKYSRAKRKMLDHERVQLDECFVAGASHPAWKKYHIEALRVALKSGCFEMAGALLEKDQSHKILADEAPIIPDAIDLHSGWDHGYHQEPKEWPEMIRKLVSHGAQVNAGDANGKTPLYYACRTIRMESFKALITLGADIHALYEASPKSDLDKEASMKSTPGYEMSKDNLLDVFLNSHLERGGGRPNTRHDYVGDNIIFLMEQGLSYHQDDSRVVKLLHATRSDDYDYLFGSALHAAVKGGQVAVVKCLLERGAVANAPFPFQDGFRGLLRPMTPIARAFEWSTLDLPAARNVVDILHACEVLVKAGADDNDCQLLLEQCAKQGNEEMVKRLLGRGTRLAEIPFSENIDIVRLFMGTNTKVDASQFQRYSVEKANLGLMKLLVEKHGPALPMGEFGYIAFEVMRGKSQHLYMAMLRYLISEYGLDVDTTFPASPKANYHVNLLQRACEETRLEAVQILLEEGADPQCPGLPETALEYFEKALGSRGIGVSNFAEKYMPVIRLLLQHMKEPQEASPAILSERELQHSKDEQKQLRSNHQEASESVSSWVASRYVLSQFSAEDTVLAIEQSSWVEDTADTFQHEELQGWNAIRLIELEPSELIEGPIRCRVLHSHLSTNPDYEILSCEWNSSSQSIPILLNGKTFDAPLNLWSALRRLRKNDRPTLLWNDAMCNNIGDVEERNQQVALLKYTYQLASQLIVWLGETAANSNLIFEHLKDCRAKNQLNWSSYSGETAKAFFELCQRPWFFRVWSAQEISLSKKAVVMCGQDQDRLSSLMNCTSVYLAESQYHPLHGIDGPSRLSNLLDLKVHSPSEHIFLYTSHCRANDPLDKIFGIVALKEDLIPSVNYRADPVDVFRDFTQRAIETAQDINILHWLGTRTRLLGLPSWVPDFSSSLSTALLQRSICSSSYSGRYPWKVLPGLEFRACGALVMKGRPVEKIRAIADELSIDAAALPGTELFFRILHGWEVLATQLQTAKRFPQAISDAFCDTLSTSDFCEPLGEKRPLFSRDAEDFVGWYAAYGTGVLASTDKAYFDEIELIQAWIWDIKGPTMSRRPKDWSYFAKRLEMACYGRRFFITDEGSMGLAPAGAREGDEIVWFPGGRYPFIVRASGDASYELVGDCFLYDFDVFVNAEVEAREFVLR